MSGKGDMGRDRRKSGLRHIQQASCGIWQLRSVVGGWVGWGIG